MLVKRHTRGNTNTLLCKQVNKQRAGAVGHVGVQRSLSLLVLLHTVDVGVEQVARVERSTLGLGVELGAEDRTVLVDHTLVGRVVQVDEVLLELARNGRSINGITVVLRGNVALSSHQVEGWNVVGTVTVLHLDGLATNGHGQKLVTKTDTHDRELRRVHQLAEVVAGGAAVSRVTGTVGNEDTIEVAGNLVNRVVVGQASNRNATRNQTANDVLLDTTVDESNVHVANGRGNVPGSLCADLGDQVDVARILESLVLIGIVLFTDDDLAERRTLLTQVGNNSTSVNA